VQAGKHACGRVRPGGHDGGRRRIVRDVDQRLVRLARDELHHEQRRLAVLLEQHPRHPNAGDGGEQAQHPRLPQDVTVTDGRQASRGQLQDDLAGLPAGDRELGGEGQARRAASQRAQAEQPGTGPSPAHRRDGPVSDLALVEPSSVHVSSPPPVTEVSRPDASNPGRGASSAASPADVRNSSPRAPALVDRASCQTYVRS
jgi:hypothetical protein